MKNIAELKAIVADLTADLSEDDAVTLTTLIDRHYGWTGITFTRFDAETAYLNVIDDVDAEIPEDYWAFVQDSYDWSIGLPERLTERGWNTLHGIAQDYASGGTPLWVAPA